VVLDRWRLLRQAGIGAFKDLREFPAYRRIDVPLNQAELTAGTKDLGAGTEVYQLNQPQHVLAIRIRCAVDRYKADAGPANIEVSWKGTSHTDEAEHLSIDAPGEKVLTAWVNDSIDHFEIRSDNKAGVTKILKLGVLVPSVDKKAP
jgi:hypothetical protein